MPVLICDLTASSDNLGLFGARSLLAIVFLAHGYRRERAILDPSAIRSITPGHGLLLLRSARPIMLTLRPWTVRPNTPRLERDRVLVEDAIRAAAVRSWSDGA